MAGLPRLMQKLFANSGVGPLLNLGIMPLELQRRSSDTGSIVLPTGTTAQRDASASKGSLRFNSTTGNVEVFNGSAWVQVVTSSDGRGVPLGTCSMHMCRISSGAAVAPEGYLICDGSQVSYADYPDLVSLLWQFTAFAGDGSSYALLPNLHHRFLEGTTSVGEIASYVEAGLPDISGEALGLRSIFANSSTNWTSGALSTKGDPDGINELNQGTAIGAARRDIIFSAKADNALFGKSSAVQPAALCLLAIVKF